MAFASVVISKNGDEVPERVGREKAVFGTFTNGGGDTGGEIATGLRRVTAFRMQHTGAAAIADEPSINETVPFEGGTVTVVTTDGADGIWMATGI